MAERTIRDLILDSAPGAPAIATAPDYGRIKRNIGKMLSLGASEDEVDSYIAGEGVTAEQLRGQPQQIDQGAELEAQVRRGDDPDYRQGVGWFQRFSDQVMDPFGVQDEIVGAGQYVRKLVTSGGDTDAAAKAYEDAANRIRAERRVSREDTGWLGTAAEIAGGAGTTKLAKTAAAAAAPGFWNTAKQAAKVGAGYGAAAGFTTGEGGVDKRLLNAGEGAAVGAVLGPAISNVAVPVARGLYRGAETTARFVNKALQAARNPEQAAIQAVADKMVASNVSPDAVRAAISPQKSAALTARGKTDADIADIVGRRLSGEPAVSIGKDHGIAADTVDRYTRIYRQANPTPMNIGDVAAELRGMGGADPILRQARGAFGLSDEASDAAQRLIDRQTGQSGRVADIIQQSGRPPTGGPQRRFEDEVTHLLGEAKKQERIAYDAVRKNAQPIEISGPIRNARQRAVGRGGEIGTKLNEAIDLFFEPELRERLQAPMTQLRIQEAGERFADAARKGAPREVISKLRRRYQTLIEQDEFSRPLTQQKVGTPTRNVGRFIDARQELDQMIERSMQDGRPTPLTQVLTEFRRDINAAARSNNQALQSADDRFYGNRSAERVLEEGEKLAKGLNPRSREAMREFQDLTYEQQELFRVAFERAMADAALNVRQTGGAANQFGTAAFKQLVEAFYPQSAGTAIYQRGQDLLRNLNREAISTQVGNFMTGRGNSPTAPWMADMQSQMLGPEAAAEAVTGGFSELRRKAARALARQIGEKAAREQLKILTEMDPSKLLPLLNKLEKAAQGTRSRKDISDAIRKLRSMQSDRFAIPAGIYAGAD